MKLHLPSALRRALLAITALLSPTVFTTTIATATLAAITAPAMAEDLTITETQITKDITYNNVTVSSSSAHLYSTTKNANFTAGTLTVDSNGKLVVGSTSYDGSSRFNFHASKFEIETGGSITFVENPQVYATDTLYDLLVGVKQDDSIKVHNTNVYGAGHKDLTSEFLTSKIRHYMVQTNCYLTLTSGDLAINSSFEDDLLTFWVYVGDGNAENGEAKATIADGVEIAHTDTSKKNRLYGLAIYRDGSLNVGTGNNALTLANCDIGGKMVSNRDIVFSNTYFRASNGDYKYSEADVTVNGKITFANTNSSTTIVYGSLTANGEIAIEGNNHIELNSSTVLNLGGKINNAGSLTLGGTINLNAANFTHSTASSFDDVAYNGYEVTTTTYLGVITGTGTVAGSATWKVGGNTATYNAGDVTVTTTDKSTYRVSSGNVDLSTVLESNDTNKILLFGGNLVVNTDISSLIPEITTVDGAASTVTINTSLNQNALTATDDKTITLCGTGSYVINGTDLSLGTGIMISDSEWSGTVKTTGATAVSGAVNTTGWKNTELNGTTTVNNGATLTLGGNTKLNGLLENNGSVVLGGTITVDDTAFTAGTRERYSAGNNGYKITDTTYTVLTGGAATGTATWKVGTQSATYEDGMVIVDGIEDTAVYYVRNGDVAYTRALANDTTTFSLDGGHLVLNESLKDTQSIEWKSTVSWLNINNNAVELKSSQLSTVGADNFTLIAPNGGTYIIDKKVGDIVELTLGTGVTLLSDYWWGWVKTVGDTTVSSDLDTTGWKNTELNGTTTVNSGVTLTLGGNTKLKGQIVNNGTLVLGGKIDVLGSMTHTSKATFATTGDASDLGTESGSGFASSLDVYSVVEGNSATGSATWTVDGQAAHYDSGKVSLLTGKDTTTWWMNAAAAYSSISGNFVTGSTTTLALNTEGGTLQLDTDPGVKLVSKKASTVEIGNGVTLNAAQLDASAADVTLSGSGSYTLEDGANALNTGVGLGSDWSGTVKLTGAADALALSSLGNALSSIDLGSFNHTLADGEHVINSALMGSGSLTLNKGSKLTLNGDCSNWRGDIFGQVELELTEGGTIGGNVQVDSLHIGESSTTFEGNLTTTGTITVSENATLSLNGNTTLGGTIESADSGTVELAGQITVDVENFKSSTEVKDVTGYFIGNATTPNSTNSGFEAACWDITIAEGGTITDKGATWKLVGDENATFDFAADGTLHAYGSGVGTVFHVAEGDTITYSESNAEDFVNSKGEAVSAIQLNGGTLELGAALDTTVKSAAASSVVIADGVTLNASQLDASAADVTLSGEGSYTMQGQELSGVVELNTGVELDTNEWKGTVYTGSTAQGAALNITALGNSQSTVYLGAQPMRRAMPGETVLESLTAAGVGTTEIPGSLTLQKGTSTADALVVNGILTLGSADAAAYLEADSVSLQGLSFAHADSRLVAGSLEGATTLNVQLTDEVLSNMDAGETLTLVTLQDGYAGTLTFNGSTETERVRSEDNRKEYTLAWNEAGTALTLTILGTETYVAEQVKPTTHNGKAGVALMTDVFLNSRPQKDAPDGALAGILNAVDAGTATDRDMAAVAGASTAALGMALSGDVERQLRAIRNRSLAGNDASTTTLVDEKSGLVSMEAPARFFAWVNAEGNRAEQNDDSTAAGYTLTSWGGTLGAGMQVNDQLTLGLALTAMYGDLQSDGPDSLDGDMDTTYLSAFARYAAGKWSHALIGTVGTMEADYKRTVSHATDSYHTYGDTDGTAFGLMYEVSRDFTLGSKGTLSPVFNISYRHAEVDGYSESGTDAALNVGKQSMDTVTLGAGARYAAVVGQQTLNRVCGFEARALVKYDLGDTQTDTSVGFINHATRANIESAELGAFGVELGAGISVPVSSGSIFADGAVELRSDYTNFNAAVGYRVQF